MLKRKINFFESDAEVETVDYSESYWNDKSKAELQAIVKCMKPIPVPPDSCFDTPGNTKPSANAWGES